MGHTKKNGPFNCPVIVHVLAKRTKNDVGKIFAVSLCLYTGKDFNSNKFLS